MLQILFPWRYQENVSKNCFRKTLERLSTAFIIKYSRYHFFLSCYNLYWAQCLVCCYNILQWMMTLQKKLITCIWLVQIVFFCPIDLFFKRTLFKYFCPCIISFQTLVTNFSMYLKLCLTSNRRRQLSFNMDSFDSSSQENIYFISNMTKLCMNSQYWNRS